MSAELALEAEQGGGPVTAWRVWRLSPRPARVAVLGAPLWRNVDWPRGQLTAWCPAERFKRHRAPERGCNCGVRGLTDLGELLAHRWFREPGPATVLGTVTLSGRLLGLAVHDDDPPSMIRAEHGRLGDRLYVPRQLWARIPDLKRTFPHVDVHQVWAIQDAEGE